MWGVLAADLLSKHLLINEYMGDAEDFFGGISFQKLTANKPLNSLDEWEFNEV